MRRPMHSNVTRRRMFSNGGMGMTKPAASGILASSQPLVDVLAGQARDNLTNGINVGNQMYGTDNINVGNQMYGSNVQGTNLMNQGGIANYAPGGFGSNPDARISLGGNEELLKRLVPSTEYLNRRNYPPGITYPTARSMYQYSEKDISSEEYPNKGYVDLPGRGKNEGKSRFQQALGYINPVYNVPLNAPLSGIAQFLTSGRGNENETGFNVADDFSTASPTQLSTIDALLSMNEGREEEILAAAKEVITNQGSTEDGVGLKEQITDILNQTPTAPTEEELTLLEAEKLEKEKRPVDLGDLGMSKVAPKTTSNGEVVEGTVVDAVDNSNIEEIEDIVVTGESDAEETITEETAPDDPYDFTDKDLYDAFGANVVDDVRANANANDEKTTEEKMAAFKEEFKNAMPEYQGMSDEEKGNAWIKMGMAIAAGQSGNAITNIANGVLATLDEFADDPKQRREYEMKVALAGGKYALERLGQDRVKLEGIEKEGRTILDYVTNKAFTYNGKDYVKGDPFQITRAEFTQGVLGDLPAGAVVQPAIFADMEDTLQAFNAFKTAELGSGALMSDWNKQSTEYGVLLDNMQSGINMRMYLGEATDLINNGDVMGASGYLKQGFDRALNALKIDPKTLQKWRSDDRDMYNAKMKQIGTQMLTKILNEGTKTISDQDRKRVEELIATMTDFAAGTISIDVVNEKIIALDGQIEKGLRVDGLRLGTIEANWMGGKVKGSAVDPEKSLRVNREGMFPSTTAQITSQGNKVFKFEEIWDVEKGIFKRGIDWGRS
tara:strand:- start:896 stop:3238 length:2343 start_codon:yes stop_codon:yes gene_type:complete